MVECPLALRQPAHGGSRPAEGHRPYLMLASEEGRQPVATAPTCEMHRPMRHRPDLKCAEEGDASPQLAVFSFVTLALSSCSASGVVLPFSGHPPGAPLPSCPLVE
jgi:hypothetical protein